MRHQFALPAKARLTRLEIGIAARRLQAAPRSSSPSRWTVTDGEASPTSPRTGQQHRRRVAEPRRERPHRDLLEVRLVEPQALAVGDDRPARRARGSPSGNGPAARSTACRVARSVTCRACRRRSAAKSARMRLQRAAGSSAARSMPGWQPRRRATAGGRRRRWRQQRASAAQQAARDAATASAQSSGGGGASTSRQPFDCSGPTRPAASIVFDQARGAVVADLEPALHAGDRTRCGSR